MKKIQVILLTLIPWIGFAQNDGKSMDTKDKTQIIDNLKVKNIKTNNDTLWKTGGVLSLSLTQVSLSNWSGGGQSSVSTGGLISLFANYAKDNTAWDNSTSFAYGVISQNNSVMQKSDDRIEINSKFGYKASKHWYYSGFINFKSQFAAGYNVPNDSVKISDFLAPGYVLTGIGMNYKQSDNFSALISPVAEKMTVVNNAYLADAGAFNVKPATYDTFGNKLTNGSRIRNEIGANIKISLKLNIMKNVGLESKIDLFSNYLHNPQNIDVNWEVLVNMKVNKFISATLSTLLIYDDDIDIIVDKNNDGVVDAQGPRVQFKEVMAMGLSYNF